MNRLAAYEILESANEMLCDINYALRGNDAHTGVIKIGDNKYQLSFVISQAAYMEIIGTVSLHYDAHLDNMHSTLFGIPVSLADSHNAPPVALTLTPID